MKKVWLGCTASALLLSTALFAEQKRDENYIIEHKVTMSGLAEQEGRYIKAEITDSIFTDFSYQLCFGNGLVLWEEFSYNVTDQPFYRQVNAKFSICFDEQGTDCVPVAQDNYVTKRNQSGHLENDVSNFSFDISDIKQSFTSCEPIPFPDDENNNGSYLLNKKNPHLAKKIILAK